MGKSIAFLGTGSDVGKSILTAGLLRIIAQEGISCAPFKAQNMSNNSFVTVDGFEIGRAQAVQAEAAGIEIESDMNPILLKPSTENGSQVVINGSVWASNKTAREYYSLNEIVRQKAFEALDRLISRFDVICIEGAGSCAEVNLRERDFVNFASAAHVNAPVILVADIDRGGVFAQIIGTLEVLTKFEREMVKGIIVNKFRGDKTLFESGVEYIENRTDIPVLGVLPYKSELKIDSEDSLILHSKIDSVGRLDDSKINIAVIAWESISNHTDIDPLMRISGVNVDLLRTPRNISNYDALILPGAKNVLKEAEFLKTLGWDSIITSYRGIILGICGGFQLLGRSVEDPFCVEGIGGRSSGLSLLSVETYLSKNKRVTRSVGETVEGNIPVTGYEIHMGETVKTEEYPFLFLRTGLEPVYTDGAVSQDGRIMGTYLHGIFDSDQFTRNFLKKVAPQKFSYLNLDFDTAFERDKNFNLLAEHIRKHCDVDKLLEILG